ncbi:MAG: 4-alpha-glucanotransferase [Bauldia sp.]|nr:4-alpha-glucanotransferase [Bauldia sp.]
MSDAGIGRIVDLLGIAGGYRDYTGREIASPIEARRTVAAALGFPTGTEGEIADSLARIEGIRLGLLPPLVVAPANQTAEIAVRDPGGDAVAWTLTDEAGAQTDGQAALFRRADGKPAITLPPLPAGYHQLSVTAGDRTAAATVIAAPPHCWRPDRRRRWGIGTAAFALSSTRDLGIGSYSDVAALAEGAGRKGASFLGLLPLHALFAGDRGKISPYSPSSRLFLETIHIDPAAVLNGGAEAGALLREVEDTKALIAIRADPLVEHAAAWALKRPVLDALWAAHRGNRLPACDAFRAEGGERLETHATFEALFEALQEQGYAGAAEWPAAYRDPRSPAVEAFRRERADLVAFHAWLQWLCDSQLAAAQSRAKASGMAIGLYRDLAVGADRYGSETWSAPDWFGLGLSVGAPPDPLATMGQDWGVPPFHPVALETSGLAGFRALVAANMRHAGALRVDHVFQLRRLFLIPVGARPTDGVYVDFPLDAFLAALRVESHRAGCLVIGEDLGTAPDNFAAPLSEAGVFGYRVVYFERSWDGGFKAPEDYTEDALATINTHDLATFAGWWAGHDIADRVRFGISTEAEAAEAREDRQRDRWRLVDLLARHGLVPAHELPGDAPIEAVVRLLARCRSELTNIQAEDLVGALEPINIPGLVEGPPNWRRRLPVSVEELLQPGGPVERFAGIMAVEGRSG